MNRRLGLRSLAADTRGAHHVEYLVLVGLVALAGVGAFRTFGDAVSKKSSEQARCVDALDGACGKGQGEVYQKEGSGGGGLFGSVTGWVGDRVGDVVGFARDTALPFALDYTPLGFHWGVWQGVGASVVTLGHAVTHPIETLQGLSYAAGHPAETLWTFGASSWDAIRESPAQGLGGLTWNVGSFFIPGVGAAGSTTRAVTTAATTSSSVTSVADAGSDASNANGTPAIVRTIDNVFQLTPNGVSARITSGVLGIFD